MQGTNAWGHPLARCAAAALPLLLAACGGGDGKSSQVAVRVNKDELTVLQVNQQLARLPSGVTPEQLEPATRKIIGSLINQQLLVQQAVERKLDRDPEVLGALEAARLNILAQAYVQRVIAPQAKPSETEIRKYYADNPALFAERKVYRLQELTIEAGPQQEKQIETAAAGTRSLKPLAEYLHAQKIPFSADSGVRTAEQLPLQRLPQIAALKAGEVLVFPTGENRASAIEVLASEMQPVDDKKAAPVIEQFLGNRKRDELAASELKRLRDAAKIEYVGDFTKYATAPVAADGGVSPAPAAATASAAAAKTGNADQDKGIAALR
jgi:EpsD family peptidyl-prolyl cis-trans isomerase